MVSAGIQPTLLLCDGAEQFSFFIKSLTGRSSSQLNLGGSTRIKVFVSLYYDRTIFYLMKNISQTSQLPVRSCENRRFPL